MSQTSKQIVIVGAGVAGMSVATSLRQRGFVGPVTLISQESEIPYDRPPLSKEFITSGEDDSLHLDPDTLLTVNLIAGVPAISLDTRDRQVLLQDGNQLFWDQLILATGARPRPLPTLSDGLRPVLTLRTLQDARHIRSNLNPGTHLLIIGGGPIGLELASSALMRDVRVTLVESAQRLMGRSTSPIVSEYLRKYHTAQGVDIRLGRSVISLDIAGEALLDDGTRVRTDLVVAGIGVQANDGLAVDAGIAADDGIFVDGYGRTTAPNVFAVGDVARQRNPVSGRFERIETWSNARGQAKTLAAALLDQTRAPPYADTPWFWSDQGSLRLRAAGLPYGDEQVVRGSVEHGQFAVIHWLHGDVVGVTTVNATRDFNVLKRLITMRSRLRPDQVADTSVDMKTLMAHAEKHAQT